MKQIKNKQTQEISIIQGGYSDIRLWPCYLAYSGSILFFAPQIGILSSVIVISIIGSAAMVYAASKIPALDSYTYDFDRYMADINLASVASRPMPDLENYMIVTPAKVKVTKPKRATKSISLKPYLDLRVKVKTRKTVQQLLASS